MVDAGAFFYDNPEVFSIYQERRGQPTSANDTLERPLILELLPDIDGNDILDLGCGDAALAMQFLQAGAHSYLGIDGSSNMVKLAEAQNSKHPFSDTQFKIAHNFIESFAYPEQSYDLVLSRLAFHYVEAIEPIFAKVYESLKPQGWFLFSVEHPIITSHQLSMKQGANRKDWVVDRYFETGKRNVHWMGNDVLKYHRTLENYYQALKKSGFHIEDLRESCPDPKVIKDRKLFEKRSRVPLFLILKAQKR